MNGTNKILNPAHAGGAFFCLASAEGVGLLFCPAAHEPHTRVYSWFCAVNAIIPHTIQNSAQGFTGAFSCDCTCSTAHDTRPTQAVIMPPVPRWSVLQRRNTSSTYQNTTATPDAVQVSTAAYYNKVYKRVQHTVDRTSPAGPAPTVCGSLASAALGAPAERGQRLHLYSVSLAGSRRFPRPAACDLAPVSSQGAPGQPDTLHPVAFSPAAEARWGGAEPLTAPPYLFSGFRPITNRGQK